MGHEPPPPPPGALLQWRSRGRPRKKHYRIDPVEGRVVGEESAEPRANGFCIGTSCLGSMAHSDELGSNAAQASNGGSDKSSVYPSKESASLEGSNVGEALMEGVSPVNCSVGEWRDEDLGVEGVLRSLESKYERNMGKRRKISRQPKSFLDMPLRRSARRPSTIQPSPPDTFVCKNELVSENVERHGNNFESGTYNSKPALPPSSSNLDVVGLPVLDLFSVYSCFRSFSRSLFLSPFRLETLVAALRCNYANPLIDSIHFSLLYALKPHLKLLMEEEFKPATDCLRNLNWDMLDLVTWPVFLVEYMLFCGSAMRSDFKLAHLKLLDFEYYEQPAELKLEILHCLCDDVVEVEWLRSELNRRVIDSEPNLDSNNNMNSLRKRKYSIMHDGESSLAREEIADLADGNSDECCLCRMDGNLICCDGCPAAFHSRCVGVVKDLLPEGEWHCPECLVDKDGVVSLLMPFKGADFLGRDSHGRLYYGCCGYLLVSDPCDSSALCYYYNKIDLISVINVLKSEPSDEIKNAISAYWGIPIDECCSNDRCEDDAHNQSEIRVEKAQLKSLSFSKEDRVCDNFVSVGAGSTDPMIAGSKIFDISYSIQPNSVTSIQLEKIPTVPAVSEPVGDYLDATSYDHPDVLNGIDFSINPTINQARNASLKPNVKTRGLDENFQNPGWNSTSPKRKGGASQLQPDLFSYVNYYSFGQVAADMAEELLSKSSEIISKDSLKPDEVIKSDQLKTIYKKFTQWSWYNYYNLMVSIRKEDCGWCFACRRSIDIECLLKVVNEKHLEGIKFNQADSSNHTGVGSGKNKKDHIVFAMNHILSIEDRVRSLLSGPWEKLNYSEWWRRAVFEAHDVASLKFLLLSLESNLRRVALLAEWLKPVDSDQTVGSASFKLTGFHWWRGGKLSRQLFCWKMLPRSLASKCSRQGGNKKIPNLFYQDVSEFAKRSKNISWRVSVEMSNTIARLLYQVKDLDSNIKWTEILSNQNFPHCTKEVKKIEKLFRHVLVRRKCVEGAEVRYLLDFGKRETIPATVTKYGVLFEECSDKRKRFWLSETHVPLNLVSAFEEKKLSRLAKKKDSGHLCEKKSIFTTKKTKNSKGLSYLFSRLRDSEKHCCGHCNKDVLVREAVSCCNCDGFFHKKHFRVPKGVTVTSYTCFKCKDKETTLAKPTSHKVSGLKRKASIARKGKMVTMSKMSKENELSTSKLVSMAKSRKYQPATAEKSKANTVSLARRSRENIVSMAVHRRKNPVRLARKLRQNLISLAKNSNINQAKTRTKSRSAIVKRKRMVVKSKGHGISSKKAESLKLDNFISWCTKKRSVLRHCYWLNGLLWVKGISNERGKSFREKMVLLGIQSQGDFSVHPMCCLCREDFNAGDMFICCESCGGS
ncbi:DDT domain-containing protein PTM isoform X2 [Phalaenopsis equestris]|uniref:DDT domain-containing protein PTM isoform X2 n=1 Tax=Phalaenopsis equestris TaxID=78828 RepID=UPI0009E3A971|nr:DDT domain-containing protein PTM isoform X2 [Phalaenopsis equestris]